MTDRALTPEERLLQSALHEADAVPSNVTEYARAVYEWREMDLELAMLTSDSTAGDLVGVRGAGDLRFTFTDSTGGTVEIAYEPASATLRGSLEPAGSGTCELLTPGATQSVELVDGVFEFADVPAGPVSLVVRLTDGRAFKTEWMTV